MKNLTFKIITDVQEAKNIWDLFSPLQTIDDEWDFRYTFNKYLNFPLHFIVGFENDSPVGLLPLQLNTNKGISQKKFGVKEPFLEFFGGIDTDNNKIFLLPGYEYLLPQFLKQIQSTAILAPLADQYTLGQQTAIHYTDKFVLGLESIRDFEMFLQTKFDGKSRQRLKNRINHFNKNYKIEIKQGTETDLELLFELSKDRFGEDSSFNMKHRRNILRDLRQLYEIDLFVIYINGVPKAVSFGMLYNKTYDGINIGYDYDIRDLGKLVFVTQIQRALELGCNVYDVGKNANGWKEHFHLNKIPQYKLAINFPHAYAAIGM